MRERSIIIEVVVDGLTIRKELPDAWSGDNPIFHAKEFRPVADGLVQEVDDILSKHFGDIREREARIADTTSYSNRWTRAGV